MPEVEPLQVRASERRDQPAKQDLQAERQHDNHDDRLADHGAQRQALDQEAHEEQAHQPDEDRERHGKAQAHGEPGDQISAGHDERALGEVGHARCLVDQDQPQGAERVHQAGERAVDGKLAQEKPIHYSITPNASAGYRSQAPAWARDITAVTPLTLSLSPWERGRPNNGCGPGLPLPWERARVRGIPQFITPSANFSAHAPSRE